MASRRRSPRNAVGILLACAVGLVACGSDSDTTSGPSDSVPHASTATPATDAAEVAPTSNATAAAFPVDVEHVFGTTTIESEPERVVSIGFTDHDALLALGVEPVGIREWYGDYDYVWPWAQDELGALTPEVLPAEELNFEQIAALDPDLIIGLYIGLDEQQYELLSAIAPTVAPPADYPSFGAPWQVMTRMAGAAVGKTPEAEAAIASTEQLFADARAAHPEFEGVPLAYAGVYGPDEANYYVETDGSTRMKVLQDLGFVVPEQLAALPGDGFYHDISAEEIELIESDVVLWEPAVLELLPAVEDNAIYQQLDVAKEDRDVFLTDPVIAGAMAHADVLSLPVVLEALVPELSRAVANLP